MLHQNKEQRIHQLAEVINVLADPIRMRIILNLTKPASVGDLQQCLHIGQIALLRHLNYMQASGLLRSERLGNEIYYSLKDMVVGRAVRLLLVN